MATNIAPHNLGEVIDATLFLIENPEAELKRFNKIYSWSRFSYWGSNNWQKRNYRCFSNWKRWSSIKI